MLLACCAAAACVMMRKRRAYDCAADADVDAILDAEMALTKDQYVSSSVVVPGVAEDSEVAVDPTE